MGSVTDVVRIISFIPNERVAVCAALRAAGYREFLKPTELSLSNGSIQMWHKRHNSKVMEVFVGSSTNASSATAALQSQLVAAKRKYRILKTVVFGCAGGMHPQSIVSSPLYVIIDVISASWGETELADRASNSLWVEWVRLHKKDRDPQIGHPATRREFNPLMVRRQFNTDRTYSRWLWHALQSGILGRASAVTTEKVYKLPGDLVPAPEVDTGGTSYERLALPQVMARAIEEAELKEESTAVVVEMESTGLHNGLTADSIVFRVVTDHGSDKGGDGNTGGGRPHPPTPGPPARSPDEIQREKLMARHGYLAELLKLNPYPVAVEALVTQAWFGSPAFGRWLGGTLLTNPLPLVNSTRSGLPFLNLLRAAEERIWVGMSSPTARSWLSQDATAFADRLAGELNFERPWLAASEREVVARAWVSEILGIYESWSVQQAEELWAIGTSVVEGMFEQARELSEARDDERPQ